MSTTTGQHEKEYRDALAFCSRVAQEEHEVATRALDDSESELVALRSRAKGIRKKARSKKGAVGDAAGKLKEICDKFDESLTGQLRTTRGSLARKQKRLSKFTVTLFGRTMAGKSTIREALTGGDGSTIGKGAQRTTRDIREYEWDHIRIVDTPGIGAFEGESDREIALSVIDTSDVVLFLVSSDSIQETAFRGMCALRAQNKPIIFVLNVKRDLTKRVYLKKFLQNPRAFLGEETVRGHINRVQKLAEVELGMRRVVVVPIHAQAAFLATRPEYAEHARELHYASRIWSLLDVLREDILQRGPSRRAQTILDGTNNPLMDLQEQYGELSRTMYKRALYLQDKFGELDRWLDVFIDKTNAQFETEAKGLLKPLRNEVSAFLEENIEHSDVGRRWRKRVATRGIAAWTERIQQETIDEIQLQLKKFQQEMEFETEILGKMDLSEPSSYSPWQVKRTLRWISAGGTAVAGAAGVAVLLGGANFWNPVGWIAGGIGIVALGLSWFFSDRESKLQREKAQASKALREQIDNLERDIVKRLKKWFYDTITKRLVRGIRTDTRALYEGMFGLSRELRNAADNCGGTVEALNRRLLVRIASFYGLSVDEGDFKRVVRDPGIRTKVLWRR
ncbi:MAG: GTPase domain-containing protein, partial [Proteobacteria bacterium]|nr:GTPase domain-containing protein [Pseudomonadota bacterium]